MNAASRRLLVLAAAMTAGVFIPAADARDPAPVREGLLGANYFGAGYASYQLHDSPVDAKGFDLESNWNVNSNLDFRLSYEWLRTDALFGIDAKQQTILAGLRAFTAEGRTRFYGEAAAGWVWASAGSVFSEKSSVYRLGIGAEFTLIPALTLTPQIYYEGYGSSGSSGSFNYGVQANAWLSQHWALTASVLRDNDSNMTFRLGVKVGF